MGSSNFKKILIVGSIYDPFVTEIYNGFSYRGFYVYFLNEDLELQDIYIDMEKDVAIIEFKNNFGSIRLTSDEEYLVWHREFDLTKIIYSYLGSHDVGADMILKRVLLESYRDLKMKLEFAFSKIYRNSFVIGFDPFNNIKYNKLHELEIANKIGLQIPKTYITRNGSEINFNLISKSLLSIVTQESEDKLYNSTGTIVVKNERYKTPEFVQERIMSAGEVRAIFLIDEIVFAFMWVRNKPAIDINDIDEKDKHYIPIELPPRILFLLKRLHDNLKWSWGVIDLLIRKNGDFVFLETNKKGQVGFLNKSLEFNMYEYFIRKILREKGN